jgi:hypothetical protein
MEIRVGWRTGGSGFKEGREFGCAGGRGITVGWK